LIGWSLGGIYARELGKQAPARCAQIITLGSPFADPDAPNRAVWIYNLFRDYDQIDKAWKAQVPNPAPVRTTAVYSKQDGVVPWQACMEKVEDALHQNVRVRSSHLGFPANPRVLRLIVANVQIR
jgi:pimeloyl-ACP methyl ester carboxylesterase